MTNITITPKCGQLCLETEYVRVQVVVLAWDWTVTDIETLMFEEELVLAYESQGPPQPAFEIDCTYSYSGSILSA